MKSKEHIVFEINDLINKRQESYNEIFNQFMDDFEAIFVKHEIIDADTPNTEEQQMVVDEVCALVDRMRYRKQLPTVESIEERLKEAPAPPFYKPQVH